MDSYNLEPLKRLFKDSSLKILDISLNNIDEKFIDIIYPSAFNNDDCKIKSIDFGCNKINV